MFNQAIRLKISSFLRNLTFSTLEELFHWLQIQLESLSKDKNGKVLDDNGNHLGKKGL